MLVLPVRLSATSNDCQAIQHIRLDRPEVPCEDEDQYRLVDCLMLTVAEEVGCQSFWSDLPGIPTCSRLEEIIRLMETFQQLIIMEKNNLTRVSGCLDPCSYMEYKV